MSQILSNMRVDRTREPETNISNLWNVYPNSYILNKIKKNNGQSCAAKKACKWKLMEEFNEVGYKLISLTAVTDLQRCCH